MKHNFYTKFKAGALQYTIFIAVVITLLIFAFISLSYTQRYFKEISNNYLEAIRNTDLAIDYIAKYQLDYDRPIHLSFSTKMMDKTTIERKNWGVFDVAVATTIIKSEVFSKRALLGGFLKERPSLYVVDNNQPLVVVGSARIEGNTYLPKQAVKRGTIAGNAYIGNELIYGTINNSKGLLPLLKNEEFIKNICKGILQIPNEAPMELKEKMNLLNSFEKPTLFFFSELPLELKEMKLTGNVIIRSTAGVKVHSSADLTDVIVIAPRIEILDNVYGIFQAFSTDKIIVGKNCKLGYPSALVLYDENKFKESININNDQLCKQVEIQFGSQVNGMVCFLSDNSQNNYKSQILIDKTALIVGEVYCDKYIELKGTIKGSVFTSGFIANEYGSVYQNHIYNGRILSSNFPLEYCGLRIENSTEKVVKWVY